jgi:hypothetical protein
MPELAEEEKFAEPEQEVSFAEPEQAESFAEPEPAKQPDLIEEKDTYVPEEETVIEALREKEEPERDSIDQEEPVEDYTATAIEGIPDDEPPVKEELKLQYQQPEFEIVTPVRKTSEFFSAPGHEPAKHGIPGQQFRNQEEEKFYTESDPINKSYAPEDNLQYIMKEETASSGTKNNAAIYITLALLVFIIAGGVYAYLQISNEVKGYKTEVGKLNTEIKNLTTEPEVNKELQKMLELPDTRTINLIASDYNPGGFGKVIINPMEGAGYLQMGGMPAQVISLWISSGRNHILLGTFKGAGEVRYFRFDLPELGQKQKFFLLTPEAAPGAENPGKQVYLSGTF